jgi:ubiquinone/menaquinone biosynthesis C-methylase UbiE
MKTNRSLLLIALLFATIALPVSRQVYQAESARLAELLNWHAGGVVADIGAGEGEMTLEAAKRVGPAGHVYSTEVDTEKLERLKELAAKEEDHNITVIEGSQSGANLPPECCDSIYMRTVYHHFAEPQKMDASLFQSLKPGGMLAVIDFPPKSGSEPLPGVPVDRGGHGMPKNILIQELTNVGFQLVAEPSNWPSETGHNYCVIFRKREK